MLINPLAFLHSLWRATGFLTRLPVGEKYYANRQTDKSDSPLYPLVGSSLGFIGAVSFILLAKLGFSSLVASLAVVALLITITGGLHEDGLSDLADGFFAPKAYDAQARLTVMKDSHIGVFGVMALIITIGLRVVLLADIAKVGGNEAAAYVLILSETASRTSMVMLWPSLPNVSPNSIARSIGAPNVKDASKAFAIGGLILLLLSWGLGNFMLPFVICLCLTLALLLLRALCRHKIGGLCGDALGAAQQVSTVIVLATAYIFIV